MNLVRTSYITKMDEQSLINEEIDVQLEVERILRDVEETRNSDKKLIQEFWARQGFRIIIPSACKEPESITRARRKLQADNYNLAPTDPYIAHIRGVKEEVMRKVYGGNQKLLNEFMSHRYGIE